MTCAKVTVIATLVHPDGRTWTGTNWCRRPQPVCPREPGEGYEKCKTVCQQTAHAEVNALKAAGPNARGTTAHLTGHTCYCRECQEVLFANGVVSLTKPT